MSPTDTEIGKTRYIVPGLKQGIEVLRLFNSPQPVWTAPQIAAHFTWPRATVYRLLLTLESLQLIERSGSHAFKLGAGVLSLGFAYVNELDLVEVTRHSLEALRDEIQCSVHLAILDQGDVLYVARYPGPGVITANIKIGARLPAYSLGLGRLLLLDKTVPELRNLYSNKTFKRFTEETPANVNALAAMIAKDRQRGFVISRSFFAPGILAISAPIRDACDKIIAALSVTNLDTAIAPGRREDRIRDAVVRTAQEISQRYRSGRPVTAGAAHVGAAARSLGLRR